MIHTILNGRYQLLGKMGGGGMAEVYEGVDLLLDREVAIKILHHSYQDDGAIQRFHREARHTASLSHLNIVTIYDVGSDGDAHYMVMELIQGPTLRQFLAEMGPLSQEESIMIALQLLKGLQHAHGQGIIHRDVKPHNVMLDVHGCVKLTDFGISRSATSNTITHTGEIMGTVRYLSPERARGEEVSFPSDIYSVGVVLYEMVAGRAPFDGEENVAIIMKHLLDPVPDLKKIDSTLSDELCTVIYRALAKEPADRYQAADEMIQDLHYTQQVLRDQAVERVRKKPHQMYTPIMQNLETFASEIASVDKQVLRLSEVGYSAITLDSAKVEYGVTADILANIQEGLFRLGKDNQIKSGIAERVEVDANYQNYTFHLRKNAKWNDGKPVTAHDFEYAWKRALHPLTRSNDAHRLYAIEHAEAYHTGQIRGVTAEQIGITAVDDYTLRVRLNIPMVNFAQMTVGSVFLPQRRDIVEKYGETYGTTPERLVFNGPFKVQRLPDVQERGKRTVVLVKNEHYWDQENVHLQTVNIDYVPDLDQQTGPILAYNKKEVDFVRLTNHVVGTLSSSKEVATKNYGVTRYMFFNFRRRFFRNEKIRKAISLALDRNVISRLKLRNGSLPAGSLIPPNLFNTDPAPYKREYEIVEPNVALARQYFQEGLAELELSHAPRRIFLDSMLFTRGIAESIQKQLEQVLNWKIHLIEDGPLEYYANLHKGEYDLALYGWSPDYNDPLSFLEIWQSTNTYNHCQFSDEVYDQLIEQARVETDLTKRIALLHQAERRLVGTRSDEKAALVPLIYEGSAYMQKPYVKELYTHPFTYQYSFKWAYIEEH